MDFSSETCFLGLLIDLPKELIKMIVEYDALTMRGTASVVTLRDADVRVNMLAGLCNGQAAVAVQVHDEVMIYFLFLCFVFW